MKRVRASFLLSHRIAWLLVFGALLLVRSRYPVRPLTQLGPSAFLDTAWSCLFSLGIILLAAAWGASIRSRFLPGLTLESSLRYTIEIAIGLGSFALLLSWLGFLQLLSTVSVSLLLLVSAVATGPHLSQIAARLFAQLRTFPFTVRRLSWLPRASILLAAAIGLLALLNTLVPAWDYDGLMYHLTGPREFLARGGIYPNPDNWYVDGPFSIELLYTLGLAHGDVLTPKLLHLVFGALYALATWGFTRRWLGSRTAWIAFAILLGMPTLPIWSGFAYIDMAWSLFEWLALACMVEYLYSRDRAWWKPTAMFLGLAVGTKYLALMGALVLVLLAVSALRREVLGHARQIIIAGLIILGIAGMWYIKNWIWFGNPVYPLYFGGPGWDGQRLDLYEAYLSSFGTGTNFSSILAMPVTIFSRHAEFGAVMNRNDILSPLFVLAWFYPLTHKKRVTNLLGAAVLLRLIFWVAGSQQIRFLLPIDPAIAVLSAYVICEIETRLQGWSALKIFLPTLAVALMSITLFFQVQLARQLRPWDVISGKESADAFLVRNVGDFAAARYIQQELPVDARVLMLGDGRSFYCAPKCIPDPDHFRWAAALAQYRDPAQFTQSLTQNGIDYFLVSLEDLDFLLQHDTQEILKEAVERFTAWRSSSCFQNVYADKWVLIYSLGCPEEIG